MAFLLRPIHWTIRLVLVGAGALGLLLVGAQVVERMHEMSALAGAAPLAVRALGALPTRRSSAMPTMTTDEAAKYLPAAIPEAKVVRGAPRGKRSLLHPLGGGKVPAVKRGAVPAGSAPELVQQRTAAQQTEITKETGLPAPEAGEVPVYGPAQLPCAFDAANHDTFECPRSKHATFRGNVEVRVNLATGAYRLIAAPTPPGFLESRGLREGWRFDAALTYGATVGGGLSGAQLGVGGKGRLSKDLFRVGHAWIVVEGEGGWRGGAYGQGGVGAEWRSEP